jgi:hypothetical protein
MIYRGDVKEGEVISVRRVALDELKAGHFSFVEKIVQHGDIKSFGGSVPQELLAAGRVVVEFTEKPTSSMQTDLARYCRGQEIVSNTGQLSWNTAGQGFFQVDTPGTKGVVGFAQGQDLKLGTVSLRLDSPYAAVFLTALERNATLADTRSALLSVVARNCNTGFKYFALDGKVLDNGTGPILLEPVKATITFSGRRIDAVHVLDHDGRRTGKKLVVADGQFRIDGTRDRALYYEVVFP